MGGKSFSSPSKLLVGPGRQRGEPQQTRWHYVHGLSWSSFFIKRNRIDRSRPQWCFKASFALLGSDWPLGIIKEEDGEREEGWREAEAAAQTERGPPNLLWPFTQEPGGAARDLIERIPLMCLGLGWGWRRRRRKTQELLPSKEREMFVRPKKGGEKIRGGKKKTKNNHNNFIWPSKANCSALLLRP